MGTRGIASLRLPQEAPDRGVGENTVEAPLFENHFLMRAQAVITN